MSGQEITGDSLQCLAGFYAYQPSIPLAAVFCALFGVTTFIHAVQMSVARTWYMSALVLGGFCEVVGYITRILNAREPEDCKSLALFLVQAVMILCAPALTAASIYMILSRIIHLAEGERHSPIRLKWLTWLFVCGDLLSLNIQGAGGGLKDKSIARILIIVGLFIQLFFFGAFVIVAGIFHRRNLREPTSASRLPYVRWQRYLTLLYVTSALVFVRSVFRTIEFIQGYDGELMVKEFYIYIFDATLIFICMVWMNWFHPAEIGLLQKGEPTIKNGMDLLTKTRYRDGILCQGIGKSVFGDSRQITSSSSGVELWAR